MGKIFGWAPCRPSQGLEKILNHQGVLRCRQNPGGDYDTALPLKMGFWWHANDPKHDGSSEFFPLPRTMPTGPQAILNRARQMYSFHAHGGGERS